VLRAIVASSRSLGIVMTVSTHSRSSSSPRAACVWRLFPSNLNGLVTTAIVRAPSSLARLAMTVIQGINLLAYFAALLLLSGAAYLTVFGPAQLDALALLSLNAHQYGVYIWEAFSVLRMT